MLAHPGLVTTFCLRDLALEGQEEANGTRGGPATEEQVRGEICLPTHPSSPLASS